VSEANQFRDIFILPRINQDKFDLSEAQWLPAIQALRGHHDAFNIYQLPDTIKYTIIYHRFGRIASAVGTTVAEIIFEET
jgi:hypothetical protein